MTLEQVVNGWIMSNQPDIKILITKISPTCWRLDIEEDWPDDVDSFKQKGSKRLDDAVRLATQELDNWSGVTRKSYTHWNFKTKNHAEKFKVIFGLKWSQK